MLTNLCNFLREYRQKKKMMSQVQKHHTLIVWLLYANTSENLLSVSEKLYKQN